MKQQDIERLKKICEKEGYIIEMPGVFCLESNKHVFTISMVDPWDGVEFAECINNRNSCVYTNGKIYPIVSVVDNYVYTLFDDEFYPKNGRHKDFMKPSTEAAYVSQLKSKAKELYGEIKEGDEFDRTSVNPRWGVVKMEMSEKRGLGFNYDKADDSLYFGKYAIYSKGQWAKKVERVRVGFCWDVFKNNMVYIHFHKDTGNPSEIGPPLLFEDKSSKVKEIGDYLAQCLEDKLNEK
jgi:hypothetical protein